MATRTHARASNLDRMYAKFMFKFDDEKRLNACRKLSSLLKNNFTLMDALDRLWQIESHDGKKPNEPFAIVYREWQSNLEKGQTFAEASKGWVPKSETLMLTVGDISKLQIALMNVLKVSEGSKKIKSSLISALAYPAFLFLMTFIVIILVGLYLVPPLMEAAGKDIVWRGTARTLVSLSYIAADYWPYMMGGFIGLIALIGFSMPLWTKFGRVQFDRFPPWSLYKVFVGVGFLLSLSAMVKAGSSLPQALKLLSENASRYLSVVIDESLHFIANGDNLGKALEKTEREFPSTELVGDLIIYADMDGFDKSLERIADDYLENSVREIEAISNILNAVGILAVSVVIAWVVFGTFDMQDQITANFS